MRTAEAAPFALAAADRARLERHAKAALRKARRHGEALAAVTVAVAPDVDPSAIVAASRTGDEPWWCLEQPDREGSVLAALGCVTELRGEGPSRFRTVAAAWRALAAQAACDPPDGLRGSGPVAVGGFGFTPHSSRAPHWARFPAASLHVPEVALVRRGGEARLTVCVLARPDDTVGDLVARADARLEALRPVSALPLWDPDPAGGRADVVSPLAPEHYVHAVGQAVQRIRAGGLSKVVLAREVQVHAAAPHDPAAVLGVLREAFRACHVFCVGRGEAAFVAASPELLVRRDGMRAGTLALAGSTRRSADPAVDAHLGEQLLQSPKDREEQAIVTRRIEQALRPHAVWVTSAPEPVLVQMANVQHLGTPIRAQLARPVSAIELAGVLHPTPAVGGEPHDVAAPLIPALEGLDRGWYAGPVGWTDINEDGELCVALRCALLEGRVARCYAGVGVVRDSDPAAELAETEIKLAALLPILAG